MAFCRDAVSNASMLLPWSTSDEADRLAARWESKTAFPPEVGALLDSNPKTAGATLLLGIPGHRVPLTGGERASDTDLWVLGRTPRGLVSMTIERDARPVERAPAMEPPLRDRDARWAAVSALLEIERPCDSPLPARFFHRTAAALLEARRFFAVGAAVIVHAFDAPHES